MTPLQITFLVIFIVAVCAVVFFFVACEFRYVMALKRKSLMARLVTFYTFKHINKYKIDLTWWKDIKYKEVTIQSFDNLKLVGYFINNNTDKFALVVHGYGARAKEMQQYVKLFYELGYNVLAVDDRGHGKSEGKHITMGYFDKYDVSDWVKYLTANYPNSKIVVFGLSMGASTVSLYSAMKKPKNVKAIISDCGYSSAYDVINNISIKSVIFSILPTMRVFNWYCKFRVKFKLTDIDVKKTLKRCNVPILFIHGDKDKFVPFYMRDLLYNNTPKNLRYKITINGATHAESIAKDFPKYKQTVKQFLDQFIV